MEQLCRALVVKSMIPSKWKFHEFGNCTDTIESRKSIAFETRGVVRLPISLGGGKFEHNFRVLAESDANCLIGLDFLENHQFSKKKLRVNDDTFVPMYHNVYTIETNQIFLAVSTDNVWIPAGHSMIIPALILGWKLPPI